MTVLTFPLTNEAAKKHVRNAAENGTVRYLNYDDQPFINMITRRQVDICLEQGEVCGNASLNSNGHTECTLERFGAGVWVYVDVVVYTENDEVIVLVKDVRVIQ